MSGADILFAACVVTSVVIAALTLAEARGEPWFARLLTAALIGLLWAPGAGLLIALWGIDLVTGRIGRRQ